MPQPTIAQKKDFVSKTLCPRILVVSSPGIEDACSINGFSSFAELLAPFGQDISLQITIQDGQGAPYFLDKTNVRFTTDFSISKQEANSTDIDKWVSESVTEGADSDMPSFFSESTMDMDAIKSEEPAAWAPWYARFRQNWISQMRASEHESFMHPVACLLVVPTKATDPVGVLKELYNHPSVMRVKDNSFSGASVMFYHLLVHDERDTGILQLIDQKFDQIRRTFGQNSMVLRINSNTDMLGTEDSNGERNKISSIWSINMDLSQPLTNHYPKQYGSMLTIRDISALKDMVKHMMVRSIVPHMQYMIRVLSDQTANQRRGITGRLFSAGRRYFSTSSRNTLTFTGVDGELYFRYESPEAMMRKLADYSFMLKDFRFAQSVYQIARRDFQSEKVWKCYAGAQEMVGLCKLMGDIKATKAEFDSNFEDAVSTYMYKLQTPQPFLGTRCIILYYELLKHNKLYRYAPDALSRVPKKFPALVALMDEQAAYSYLKFDQRPGIRKFSFYAMLASQGYQKAGLDGLAHRCLRMVHLSMGTSTNIAAKSNSHDIESQLDAESEKDTEANTELINDPIKSNWATIDSFINHELGRQCIAAQNYQEAFKYFLTLMDDDKVPPALQSKYLQELLQLYLESSEDSGNIDNKGVQLDDIELPLPVIDPSMIRIIASPEQEGEDGIYEWTFDHIQPEKTTMDDSTQHKCHCSVGEEIAVLLMVSNPLTIGVTLNNFTLVCEFTIDNENVDESENSDQSAPFEVTTIESVALEGNQIAMNTVKIVTHKPGTLIISGARYLLCDILPTFRPLKLPGKRLNDTKSQQTGTVYSPDTELSIQVDPALPHIKIELKDFSDTLMSGLMRRATIEIQNCGNVTCRDIRLWMSHPTFFDIRPPYICSIDTEEDIDAKEDSVYMLTQDSMETKHVLVSNSLCNCTTFALVGENPKSQDTNSNALSSIDCLDPGSTLLVPIWMRGDRVGAHTFSLIIGASSTNSIDESKRTSAVVRTIRSRKFDIDLVVTPSLRINAFVRPSLKSPSERLLGIEIENMRQDLTVELVQTTFVSGYYELTPLIDIEKQKALLKHSNNSEDVVSEAKVIIGPRQSMSLMYRACPVLGKNDDNDKYKDSDGKSVGAPEKFTINALRKYIYSNEKPLSHPQPIDLIYSNNVLGVQGIDCVNSLLHSFLVRARSHWRRNLLRTNFPLIPEKYYSTLFPLYEMFNIDFTLLWKGLGDSIQSGYHSITGIDLGVPNNYFKEALTPPSEGIARTLLAESIQERNVLVRSIANRPTHSQRGERPLDVSIRVLEVSDLDNENHTGTPFMRSVTITIHNQSWRYAYSASLDLLSPVDLKNTSSSGVAINYSDSRSLWSWVGTTTFKISVEPHASASVYANIACYSQGIIDIGLWRLHARAKNSSSPLNSKDAELSEIYNPHNTDFTILPTAPYFVNVSN